MPTKDEIKQFSLEIENMARDLRCEYLDAIVMHCDQIGLEVEVASTLLTPTLKVKIREQAENNNLVKRTSKLPI
jgi:hypothetical protein